jgi:7,8-dihydropterin-6-yl-methyl-4-(beta-D-ribofuranosyl)aminobenzene 5'-phosphate synthase
MLMKVTVLFENRTISKEYKNKHGLSLYIETSNHKILFDTGTDGTFAGNAGKLGVRLEDVDIAVISHGHYDHGGGLETFLKLNNKARIYLGESAFDSHVVKLLGLIKVNIGLNKKLANNSRFVFVDELMKIDDELTLFGNVKGSKLVAKGNDLLLKENASGLIEKDDFVHEINLLINENNRHSLFCGCAHKGIINIIERAEQIINNNVYTVIGGFHLVGTNVKNPDAKVFLNEFSKELNSKNVGRYYTCHCTGEKVYGYLSQNISNLGDIKTGMAIEL